jgi:two-component system cell cycle sensor histidine kinase/response regulator CckA
MQPRVVSVNGVLRGMKDTLRRMLGERADLVTHCPKRSANVRVDPAQLEEVILNLAINGRDAIQDRGTLTIDVSVVKAGIRKGKVASSPTATEMVKIAIADDGCGMDAETRSHMFEPFFSTKELGKGTGLGLATAYGFVSQSRGTISIDSEPGRGTVVTILLPRTTERAGARLAKQKQEVQKGTESLLLVEHDPDLRASLDQLLSDCGYCVDCAPDQQTAMRIAHICDLDAIIWDEALAGNSMDKLCEELAGVCPKAKVLFLSSSGESHRSDHCVSIHKPFDLGDLTNRLRHILDSDAES